MDELIATLKNTVSRREQSIETHEQNLTRIREELDKAIEHRDQNLIMIAEYKKAISILEANK
jgi:uncharacterized protein YbcI